MRTHNDQALRRFRERNDARAKCVHQVVAQAQQVIERQRRVTAVADAVLAEYIDQQRGLSVVQVAERTGLTVDAARGALLAALQYTYVARWSTDGDDFIPTLNYLRSFILFLFNDEVTD